MQSVAAEIERAGGLVNRQDIARRWSVSRQRVYSLAGRPDFPAPVCQVRILGAMYLWSEVESWRGSNIAALAREARESQVRAAKELADRVL